MAKKTLQKANAIRVAALSGLITTTPGWQMFQNKKASHSLYSILTKNGRYPVNKNYPNLGYLLFLEQALGTSEFRKLCPLVIPVNDRLVTTLLSTNGQLTKDDLPIKNKHALCKFLLIHYSKRQRAHARQLWPSDIRSFINQTLELILPPVLTKQVPWPFCQAFLKVRYGLLNTKPIAKIRKLTPSVLKETCFSDQLTDDPDEKGLNKTVLSCANQIEAALQSPRVQPFLQAITKAFSQERATTWSAITKSALALQSSNSSQTLPDYDLDTSIYELVPMRTANALERKGYFKFRDLEDVSKGQLLAISNFGDGSLDEVETALRKVASVIELRRQANQRQLEKEKRLARQHS